MKRIFILVLLLFNYILSYAGTVGNLKKWGPNKANSSLTLKRKTVKLTLFNQDEKKVQQKRKEIRKFLEYPESYTQQEKDCYLFDKSIDGKLFPYLKPILKAGANANAFHPNYENISALEWLFIYPRSNENAIKLLLKYGANPNQRFGRNKRTFLYKLVKLISQGSINRYFGLGILLLALEKGADPTIIHDDGKNAFNIADEDIKIYLDCYIYMQSFVKALDADDPNELLQLPYEDHLLNRYFLSLIVKKCCRCFKNREFEKYKQYVEVLKHLLDKYNLEPHLLDVTRVIRYGLVKLVKLLIVHSNSKVLAFKSLNCAIEIGISIEKKIHKAIKKYRNSYIKLDTEYSALRGQSLKLKLMHQIIDTLYLYQKIDESLKYALDYEYSEYLEYLIDHYNLDINESNELLNWDLATENYILPSPTPLQYAVCQNKISISKISLKKGANPNAYDFASIPPIIIAIKNDNYKMVELLLNYKADPALKDFLGHDAFYYALKLGNPRVIDLLIWSDI